MRTITILSFLLMINFFAVAQAGNPDITFNATGKVKQSLSNNFYDGGSAVVIQSDNKIIIAAYTYNGSNYDFAVLRYNVNGQLDGTFGVAGKRIFPFSAGDDIPSCIALQADGKIVVGGTTYNSAKSSFAVARLLTNGALDKTFSADGKVTVAYRSGNSNCNALAIQKDGKIVLAGKVAASGQTNFALIRLNTSGSLDNTFSTDGLVTTSIAINDEAYSIALGSNGTIIAAGVTTGAPGPNRTITLARYTKIGDLDLSFDADGKLTTNAATFESIGRAVAIQSDGKIVVAGYGANVEDDAQDFLTLRYSSAGALDASFNGTGIAKQDYNGAYDAAYTVRIQGNGKIIIGGTTQCAACIFSDFALLRYNSNGILDAGFGTGGFVHTDFGAGPASYEECRGLAIQPDGTKAVATGFADDGTFNVYVATARYLLTSRTLEAGIAGDEIKESKPIAVRIYPNPVVDMLRIDGLASGKNNNIVITDISGKRLSEYNTGNSIYSVPVKHLAKGIYFVIIDDGTTRNALRFIKA